MKICVLTDNRFIYENFLEIIKAPCYEEDTFDFYYSFKNQAFHEAYEGTDFHSLNLGEAGTDFFHSYDLFLSLHCKQLFPNELVNSRRCINVHPGLNPYNRGWSPQVFSILNKLPVGVTIHEIDEQLDHGAIIAQEAVPINSWDTSYDVYQRIQWLEVELLKDWLPALISGNYKAKKPERDGNVNLAKDFRSLCELDLNETVTWKDAIDRLRALSFPGYQNAWFRDEKGNKVFVDIRLELDKEGN